MGADFGFTGDYYHSASGLCLTVYRAYSPNLGRWISRDPSGEESGINLYDYVRGSPIKASDPLGLEAGFFGPYKGDQGDGNWYFTISPPGKTVSSNVQAEYQASASERKCCKTFVIEVFKYTWFSGGPTPDTTSDHPWVGNPSNSEGVGVSWEDEPGWYSNNTILPNLSASYKFTWAAKCTSGCSSMQGKGFAEITKKYTVSNGQGTISDP
jgi:RHS repeat-associated protein